MAEGAKLARVEARQYGDGAAREVVLPERRERLRLVSPSAETEFGLGPDDVVIRGEAFRSAPALLEALTAVAVAAQAAGWTVNTAMECGAGGDGALSLALRRGVDA